MKIDVPNIPPEGQTVEFDQSTPWFAKLLTNEFREFVESPHLAQGRVNLYKTQSNVSCNGALSVALHPTCSRCAAKFTTPLEVAITRHLVPQFSLGPREPSDGDEGIELSEEDLDFGTYQNEEIDLGEIVAEEIRLAFPLRFLCSETCRGLCGKCGANLNEGACSCAQTPENIAFSVLKGFKVKS